MAHSMQVRTIRIVSDRHSYGKVLVLFSLSALPNYSAHLRLRSVTGNLTSVTYK
jgi:hypothetical protein